MGGLLYPDWGSPGDSTSGKIPGNQPSYLDTLLSGAASATGFDQLPDAIRRLYAAVHGPGGYMAPNYDQLIAGGLGAALPIMGMVTGGEGEAANVAGAVEKMVPKAESAAADVARSTSMPGGVIVPPMGPHSPLPENMRFPNIGLGSNAPLLDYSRMNTLPWEVGIPQFELPREGYKKLNAAGEPELPEQIRNLRTQANLDRMDAQSMPGLDDPRALLWYNTLPMRDEWYERLGEGTPAWDTQNWATSVTSPRNRVPIEQRVGSLLYQHQMQGLPPPAIMRSPDPPYGWILTPEARAALPPGYGNLMGGHVNLWNQYLEGGPMSITSPKVPSYGYNKAGNWVPLTSDSHDVDQWGLTTAAGKPWGQPGLAYPTLEQLRREQAQRLQIDTRLGLPSGDPRATAPAQSIPWMYDPTLKSPRKTYAEMFEDRVRATAAKMQEDPRWTLDSYIRGNIPLYSAGGAAIGVPGLLDAIPGNPARPVQQ